MVIVRGAATGALMDTSTVWDARQLQVAWMSLTPIESKATALYSLLTTEDPLATQTGQVPTPAGNVPFEQAQGTIDSFIVNIQKQPNRLDLIIQPSSDSADGSGVERFYDHHSAIIFSKTVAESINNAIGKINRIGIVANLLKPQKSKNDANLDLIEKLDFAKTMFHSASDISVTVNFPEELAWGRLNKVGRWAIEIFRGFQMSPQMGVQFPTLGEPTFASSLMIDINTVSVSEELDGHTRLVTISKALSDIQFAWEHGKFDPSWEISS